MEEKKTNNGKRGGLLKGKPHYDKNGNSLGGIKAVVTDANNKPVELEGGEVIINKEASKKYWKELSRINQSAGNGVPIGPPSGADEDPEEFKDGGRIIEFNPNHIPNKWVVKYAISIKEKHPEIWALGGNIFGNEAFVNLKRVIDRGHWLDSEEWMYIKWRSYVARHKQDFRIEGVVAMLKWCDKIDKGWAYMKDLIEEKIEKIKSKKEPVKSKMENGGKTEFYGVSDEDEKKSAIAQDRLKQFGSMNLFKNGEAFKTHLKEYYFKKPLSDIFGTKVIITPGNFHRLVFKLKDEIAKEKIDKIFEPIIERFNKINSKDLKIIEFKGNSFVVEFFEKSKTKMQQGGEVEDLTKLRNLEKYVLDNLDEIKSNRKTYGFTGIGKITNPYDLSSLLGVDSRIFKNADIPYYAEFIADLIKSGKKMETGGEVKQPSIEEITAVLLNHLKKYSKEVYGEDIDDDSFMVKTTKNGEHYQAEEVSAITKSGQEIHITVEELYMKRGGEIENNTKIIGKYTTENKATSKNRYTKEEIKKITPDKYYKYEYFSKYLNDWVDVKKTDSLLSLLNTGYDIRLKEDYRYVLEKGGEIEKVNKTYIIQGVNLKKGDKFQISDDSSIYTFHGLEKNKRFGFDEILASSDWDDEIKPIWRIDTMERNNLFIKKYSKGGELSKGIRAEKEHQKTIDKIYSHKVKKSKAPELIAKDHLKEDKKYYSKLEKMEGKKFSDGGAVNEYEIGTEGVWGGRGNPRIKVTKITAKTISYIDFSDNKVKFDTKEKFDRLFKPDNSSIIPTTQTSTTPTTKTVPAPPPIKTIKKIEPGSLLKRIEKLEPTFIPSTDPSTWNAEYNLGDVVKIRIDMEDKYPFKKLDGTPVKYEEEENTGTIIKIEVIPTSKRKENPSGKIYTVSFNGNWEGKDLELAYVIDKKQSQQQTAQQQIQKPKKQLKTIEPEPVKRKFDSSKDYVGIFKNYFEKDMKASRIVSNENIRQNIVNDFIISSQEISGFDKEKLEKIKSYIKEN